jgi:hypothetical protein
MRVLLVFMLCLAGCVDIIDATPDAQPAGQARDADILDNTYYVSWTPINPDCTVQANLPDKLTLADDSIRWSYAGCPGWGHDGSVVVLDRTATSVRLSEVSMIDCSDRKLVIEATQLYWSGMLSGQTLVHSVCTTEFRISAAYK